MMTSSHLLVDHDCQSFEAPDPTDFELMAGAMTPRQLLLMLDRIKDPYFLSMCHRVIFHTLYKGIRHTIKDYLHSGKSWHQILSILTKEFYIPANYRIVSPGEVVEHFIYTYRNHKTNFPCITILQAFWGNMFGNKQMRQLHSDLQCILELFPCNSRFQCSGCAFNLPVSAMHGDNTCIYCTLPKIKVRRTNHILYYS